MYRSQATIPFDTPTVRILVRESVIRNDALAVTGLLLYTQPAPQVQTLIAQWIEGPRETVLGLYARIRSDVRHDHVETIVEGPLADLVGVDGRLFPRWSMRYEATGSLPTSLPDFLTDWLARRGETGTL